MHRLEEDLFFGAVPLVVPELDGGIDAQASIAPISMQVDLVLADRQVEADLQVDLVVPAAKQRRQDQAAATKHVHCRHLDHRPTDKLAH